MEKKEKREYIANRVAQEFKDGDLVNLGIGLPALVSNYIPDNTSVMLQSENGFVGVGKNAEESDVDIDIINAGGAFATTIDGAAFFDSGLSFAMIRGGHVDVTVLGALQVDMRGNIASWIIPGKIIPGMGGAMDLVVGAKQVIVAMEHTNKGQVKILKECSLPLTAKEEVNVIITELAVFRIIDCTMFLTEIAPHSSLDEIKSLTEADFVVQC